MVDNWGYTLSAYLLSLAILVWYWLSMKRRIARKEEELSHLSKGREGR